MEKIEKLLAQIKKNDLDFNKGLNQYSDDYLNACIEIREIDNISHMPYIMETLHDWHYSGSYADWVGDLIVGYYHTDSQKTVETFISNIDKMYPHAKETLAYILSEFLAREACKGYAFDAFSKLSFEKKIIFKEIYLNVLIEDSKLAIPEIDEAIKGIN